MEKIHNIGSHKRGYSISQIMILNEWSVHDTLLLQENRLCGNNEWRSRNHRRRCNKSIQRPKTTNNDKYTERPLLINFGLLFENYGQLEQI